MTNGPPASGVLPLVDSTDFVCDLADLTEMVRRVEMTLRLHQAEQQRLLHCHHTSKRDVFAFWQAGNETMESIVLGLGEVQARMATRQRSIAWTLARAAEKHALITT
jgi:hypothetical protein